MASGSTAYWWLAGGSALTAALAALADRRRQRRPDLDRVGWMPWPLIQILAMLGAAIGVAFALKG